MFPRVQFRNRIYETQCSGTEAFDNIEAFCCGRRPAGFSPYFFGLNQPIISRSSLPTFSMGWSDSCLRLA
jgi:hypothetical protein